MIKIITRIKKSLRKEHFAVVQIYGSQGSGKTILANEIISKFSEYEIKRINNIQSLKKIYSKNTIEIMEDISFVWRSFPPIGMKINIANFYSKPKLRDGVNLIRILVTLRRIDLESQFAAYRHYRESIIDVTTGYHPQEIPFIPYHIRQTFTDKYMNVFERKLKTRPYLITTAPYVIGRCKMHRKP